MSFYDKYSEYKDFDFDGFFNSVTDSDVLRALGKERLTERDFLTLLSPAAGNRLEEIAQKAHKITIQNFGRTVTLFTPLYLSNICESQCVYCGFNRQNDIKRCKLNFDEVEAEGKAIADMGFSHIIILTGESPKATPAGYIAECARILKKYAASISVEVYSLEVEDYKLLIEAGVDGFTMFQETYNPELYEKLHLAGIKKDYRYRLDTPERAAQAGMNVVNVGALLGLDDWRKESFFTALHAKYIRDKYPAVDVAVSLPRIRPHVGDEFVPASIVTDADLVQIMTASRVFIPRLGITISTRENPEFRNNIIGLGVTKISAGAKTEVGGHSGEEKTEAQFDVSDERGIEEMADMIISRGYQPVYKDWF
ncbi:MAG: 2-iminoacetate synthase ThiH [Oscillospiraceae bacterium]|nr:2-iminoacetate synthase ThiH [Oscillospiraceae bacterium]